MGLLPLRWGYSCLSQPLRALIATAILPPIRDYFIRGRAALLSCVLWQCFWWASGLAACLEAVPAQVTSAYIHGMACHL